jgi:hypothetical protein
MMPAMPDERSETVPLSSFDAPQGVHVIDGKHEAHRLYRVITEDDGVVERTAREVALGSKMWQGFDLWRENVKATVQRVRRWCGAHASSIRFSLVDIRADKMLIYFVPDSQRYDLELGAAMTELEVELGGSAGVGYVETLQVPYRSLDRFVGPKSLVLWQRPGEGINPTPKDEAAG